MNNGEIEMRVIRAIGELYAFGRSEKYDPTTHRVRSYP